jgi:hypothetical protein
MVHGLLIRQNEVVLRRFVVGRQGGTARNHNRSRHVIGARQRVCLEVSSCWCDRRAGCAACIRPYAYAGQVVQHSRAVPEKAAGCTRDVRGIKSKRRCCKRHVCAHHRERDWGSGVYHRHRQQVREGRAACRGLRSTQGHWCDHCRLDSVREGKVCRIGYWQWWCPRNYSHTRRHCVRRSPRNR